MAGDAQATRRRLLDAAAQEFAAFGIAGARVDRIAELAQCNKAQIYHYFGSKDQLFDAVFDALVGTTLREVPIDVDDLAEYAGRLFDSYERRPQVPRLATWHRLERAGTDAPLASVVKANREKVAAIARAQKAGRLPSHFAPADLLAAILALSGMWGTTPPEFRQVVAKQTTVQRRRVVTDAVTAVLLGGARHAP